MKIHQCDILIVGAGPAGSCAAAEAAREGVCTVLIEARPRIGEVPHCGEFVPEQLFREYPREGVLIHQRVDTLESRITEPVSDETDNERHALRVLGVRRAQSAGYLIDRVRFDRDLARKAAAAGATVLCSTRLIGRDNDVWVAVSGGERIAFRCRSVIAADGAASAVARLLGLEEPDYVVGMQVEAPLQRAMNHTLTVLDRRFVHGYGWVFPKGPVANVGIGVARRQGVSPRDLLEEFCSYLIDSDVIRHGRLARSGGLIPVSGLRERLVLGDVVFCGDAAGLTHPVTGAGIPQAVFSGKLAGLAAALRVKTGRSEHLADYEHEIATRYRGPLRHALSKRECMRAHWMEDDFTGICRRTWIGFPGYRIRERSGGGWKP